MQEVFFVRISENLSERDTADLISFHCGYLYKLGGWERGSSILQVFFTDYEIMSFLLNRVLSVWELQFVFNFTFLSSPLWTVCFIQMGQSGILRQFEDFYPRPFAPHFFSLCLAFHLSKLNILVDLSWSIL